MKIVITGGAGFIGRWLLKAVPPDATPVVIDSLIEEVHGSRPDFPADVRARATCIRCDLRDVTAWRDAAAGADVVVHLAALTGTGQSMYQQRRYVEHNVLGTSALCEAIAEMPRKPSRLILASSRAVYGEGAFEDADDGHRRVHPGPRRPAALAAGRWEVENASGVTLRTVPTREDAPLQPASIYGMTKMWQEQLVGAFAAAHGIEHVVFRFQNVYGPVQQLDNPYTGILGVLANGIVREGRVELFEDGEMSRDFVFVGDIVKALLAAIEHRGPPLACTLNVGSGRRVSLRSLAEQVAQITGRQPVVACRGRYRLGDVRHAWADMSAFEKVFGPWRPATLEEGLKAYLKWFGDQPIPQPEALQASLDEMAGRGMLLEGRR